MYIAYYILCIIYYILDIIHYLLYIMFCILYPITPMGVFCACSLRQMPAPPGSWLGEGLRWSRGAAGHGGSAMSVSFHLSVVHAACVLAQRSGGVPAPVLLRARWLGRSQSLESSTPSYFCYSERARFDPEAAWRSWSGVIT